MNIRTILMAASLASIVAGACALAADRAAAQRLPGGAAFAAIDQSGRPQQHCFAATLSKARACVVQKCRISADKVGMQCLVTSACDQSGWAGVVSVKTRTATFTMTMCGVASRVGLIARLKDLCRSYSARGLDTCSLDTVWTPESVSESTALVWTPRNLRRPRRAWR